VVAGEQPVEQGGARAADMEEAGRRGREAGDDQRLAAISAPPAGRPAGSPPRSPPATRAGPEEDAEAMRRSGLAHLLSVSGLHIAAVVGAAMLLTLKLLALSERLALALQPGAGRGGRPGRSPGSPTPC
jgi:hypothetical protein